MRWVGGLALALALVLQARAGAEPGEAPALVSPLPFDHATHADVFRRTGLACVDCHPVGLRLHTDQGYVPPPVDPPPPLASCHGCHRAEYAGAPRMASNECMACHSDREDLRPASHGLDWVEFHGPDARARGAECSACHETDQCIECHEARGPGEGNPHPPGFRSFHGIDARLDPQSCSSCHDGAKCAECHDAGALPW